MTENKNGWGGICRKCFHHVKYWHHHLCLREALATANAWHLKISTISSSESSATTKSLNLNLFISEKKSRRRKKICTSIQRRWMGMTKSVLTHTKGMGWSKSGDVEDVHFLNGHKKQQTQETQETYEQKSATRI